MTAAAGPAGEDASARTVPGEGGLPKVVLQSAGGATAEVYLHGAHLTSWRASPTPGDGERIFLSARSEFRDGVAIRGGVPVIFPQFATEGPLPRHGFARTLPWTLTRAERLAGGDATATFELRDSPATRAIWPHAFLASLTVRVGGERLGVTLSVDNAGEDPFSFTCALHTYLRVHDVSRVELVGLHGARFRESGTPTLLRSDHAETLEVGAGGEIDRVYVAAPPKLTLREPSPARGLGIESSGFEDVVVWNPGAERAAALADMEPGGERSMLCVEAAVVQQPVILDAGRRWSGSQILLAHPLA